MSIELKPCPVCHGPAERTTIYGTHPSCTLKNEHLIHCPKGCRPHWNSFPVILLARDVPEWDDVADAWNTMTTRTDEAGLLRVSFDRFPPHKRPIIADGPYMPWPRKEGKFIWEPAGQYLAMAQAQKGQP